MRARSLWQPWASFVRIGLKRIETRGRRTHVRGRFHIHAANQPYHMALIQLLEKAGVDAGTWGNLRRAAGDPDPDTLLLPCGALIAIATLEDCVPIEPEPPEAKHPSLIAMTYRESVFGDYQRGRWAWLLKDVEPIKKPIPCKGRQGWWNVDWK